MASWGLTKKYLQIPIEAFILDAPNTSIDCKPSPTKIKIAGNSCAQNPTLGS